MHEKAQKIWHGSEGQKVGENCASENRIETQARREENRVETQARRQEGSRRDRHSLNGVQFGRKGLANSGAAVPSLAQTARP
jgi:hypothetical protein